MQQVFLATLGQRPEAITMGLDALLRRLALHEIVILHTEPQLSGIADAVERLAPVLATDYEDMTIRWQSLWRRDGSPLFDIHDQGSAEDYFHAVYEVLLGYKQQGAGLHLLVAGGRKAMSIYATLAASLLFDEHDRVWTVLAAPHLIQIGKFHAQDAQQEQVHLVPLPLRPSRLLVSSLPQALVQDPKHLVQGQPSRREHFLNKLSKHERILAETIVQHRYESNEEIAVRLHKAKRTVETQLRSIYSKLASFLDYGEAISNKRQALLDILLER